MRELSYHFRNSWTKLLCTWDFLVKAKIRNGKIALHCMFKNEAPYLKEWLDFHYSQGVNFIYLTNDSSSDDWEKILRPYRKAGLLDWEHSISHPDFYTREEYHKKKVWARAQKDFEWLVFLDSDEFLYSEQSYSSLFATVPKNASGLVFNWLIYGTAHKGQISNDELMLEELDRRFPDSHEEHFLVKSALRSGMGARFFNKNPHYPNYSPWAPLFWSDGQRFRPNVKRFLISPVHIKHYWYRDERYFDEVKRPRRKFFDGQERSAILEDWHYRRANAVHDPIPESVITKIKAFHARLENL